MRNVTGENGRALLPPFLIGEQGSPFVGFRIRLIAVSRGLSAAPTIVKWYGGRQRTRKYTSGFGSKFFFSSAGV
ncbi:MAG TPA: hypothetical protein VEV85_09890, partial [Bryobacteraceae bacterium]|nr:hypothetical protein [Bryobacteraceae bacterium]